LGTLLGTKYMCNVPNSDSNIKGLLMPDSKP
jgi:hypothetical protein